MTVWLKQQLTAALNRALALVAAEKNIVLEQNLSLRVEYPPQFQLGHYSSPSALELAKVMRDNPRKIAESLVAKIKELAFDFIADMKIEGPGFINFFIAEKFCLRILQENFNPRQNLDELSKESQKENQKPLRYNIEFVSANPTGPLNIVSARAASVGDAICRILSAGGIEVSREYYVNDYGNQIRLLGISVAHRYLEKYNIVKEFPADGYQGKYIIDVMEQIIQGEEIPAEIEKIEQTAESNTEAWLESAGSYFGPLAVEALLKQQQKDLQAFGVEFDRFFRESQLHQNGKVDEAFAILKNNGYLYRQDEAWFFASTQFGDDKDRVVMRSDGRPTYLMADIAYHYDKVQRGYDVIINLWGPDHHGYIARLKGAVKALGFDKKFEVLIVQQVNLLENGQPIVMSKRLGQFQTMKDLIAEIPYEAARYFFVTRSSSTPLDFDLSLAKEQSNKNPVFYVEYAHARIHSIFRELQLDFDDFSLEQDNSYPESILQNHERLKLLLYTLRFYDEIYEICKSLDFHRMTNYLYELANVFTGFYSQKENRLKDLMVQEKNTALLLLQLCKLTALTLEHGLKLLGISAPRQM